MAKQGLIALVAGMIGGAIAALILARTNVPLSLPSESK